MVVGVTKHHFDHAQAAKVMTYFALLGNTNAAV
jgi:hypothetical protein